MYGMYETAGLDSAPKVRIEMMAEALSGRVHTERITGGRLGRFVASVRWLVSCVPRRVGAVYVESPTANAMPTDLAFLALMRLLRRPVGVYFRDAYQLFRDIHPRTRRRQVLTDFLWRLTTPLLKRVASVRFVPTEGLAQALGLTNAILLPPGTDPKLPDLGIGEPDVVATIAQVAPGSGLDTLVAAIALVRERRPAARLIVAARSVDGATAAGLRDRPAATADGERILLVANIGTPDDAPRALAARAEGVGLFRTEFLFMSRQTPPTETEQVDAYRRVLEAFGPERPVVIRLADIGGDKAIPYLRLAPEQNPFLGVRAIRLAYADPDLLLTQLRAIWRA